MPNSSEKKNCCGDKIRAVRENALMSRETLSEKLALLGCVLSETEITDIENGTRCIYDTELPVISRALQVSVTELLS